MQTSVNTSTYQVRRHAGSRFETIRERRQHVRCWGGPELVSPERPPLVLMHGWMDMGASFQFVVDALAAAEGFERWVLADRKGVV
jgi:pimeloyl-ACP methyl ester carboxylesterase